LVFDGVLDPAMRCDLYVVRVPYVWFVLY
jgi:hypothetical protein